MLWLQTAVDALLPRACAACDGPAAGPLCARCLDAVEPAPADTCACALYGGPLAQALRRAKFGRDVTRAVALGRLWCERLEAGACALPDVDAIAFVPTHWRRRLARGFDLPAVLASSLAGARRLPLVEALATVRRDPPLSFGADRAERQVAVAGRFRARAAARGRLLLVDDVRTTGATLGEAARVLRAAGADVVEAPFAIVP